MLSKGGWKTLSETLEEYLNAAEAAVKSIDRKSIGEAVTLCVEALQRGGSIFFCGNGGSAADAQHFAGELVGRFRLERKGFRAIALTADSAVITALANDYGFREVYARQVQALGRKDDVLFALSTSGNSESIVEAAKTAGSIGMKVVSLTGNKSCELAALSDVHFVSPSSLTSHSQEAILVAGHSICWAIEKIMTSGDGGCDC